MIFSITKIRCVHGMPVHEHRGSGSTLISAKVPLGVYVGTASAARGKGVCPDLVIVGSREREGYGGSPMRLIGAGQARGCTEICWVPGGRATGTWLTEAPVLAGFRPRWRIKRLLFLNLREWSIFQELYM